MEKSEFTHVRIRESKIDLETQKSQKREFTMSMKDWEYFKKTNHPKTLKFEVIDKFSEKQVTDEANFVKLKSEYTALKENGLAVEILDVLKKMQNIKNEGWISSAISSYERKAEKEQQENEKYVKVKELIATATKFESESNIPKALEAYTEAKKLDPENELLTVRIASLKAANQG